MNTPPEFDPTSTPAPRSGPHHHAVPTRRPGRSRAVTTALVVLSSLAILAACSSSGDDASDDTTTTAVAEHDTQDDTEVGEDGDEGDEVDDGDDGDDVTTTTEATDLPDAPNDLGREPTAFERGYIGQLAIEMSSGSGMPDGVDSECLATAWVLSIGGDRLQAADLDAETFMRDGPTDLNLDRETARSMYRGGVGCGFTVDTFLTAMVPNLAECPEARFSEDDFEELMIAAFIDEVDDELEQRIEEIDRACAGL